MSEFASGSLTGKNLHLSFGSNHVLRGIDLHVETGHHRLGDRPLRLREVHPAAGHEPPD